MSLWKFKLSLIYRKSSTAKSYNLWTAVKTNKIQIKFCFPSKREEPGHGHRQMKAKGSPAVQRAVSDSGSLSPLGSTSPSAIRGAHSCTETQRAILHIWCYPACSPMTLASPNCWGFYCTQGLGFISKSFSWPLSQGLWPWHIVQCLSFSPSSP